MGKCALPRERFASKRCKRRVSTDTSSTWLDEGAFAINDGQVGLEANLGYKQTAEFGLETLGIGLLSGSLGGLAPTNQTPVNQTTLDNYSAPSYFTSLKSQGYILSLSWSYTAGAIYRLKKVYGQLIFGGYDTSRFVPNGVSFTMAGDVSRDLVVALQSITYSGSSSGESQSLLSAPIYIFIDSTDPFLWLPADACAAFEAAFSLTLDEGTGLYLVNSTHHATLLSTDAQAWLQLSDVLEDGASVAIVLPYDAFDLQVSSPLVTNGTSYYFPLKKAANDTQYTLGRTFLQEAYLSVDYERGVFNVSQCSWIEGAASTIVPIVSADATSGTSGSSSSDTASQPSSTSTSGSTSNHGLSGSAITGIAITGIAIGIVAVAGLAAAGVWALLRKRTQDEETKAAAVRQEQLDEIDAKKGKEGEALVDGRTGDTAELDVGTVDAMYAMSSAASTPQPATTTTAHSTVGKGELSGGADTEIYQMSDDGRQSVSRVSSPVYELSVL
ncbi:hypothetical protein Sste5346_005575 [Sporothrix stenoceras]|uniref:Peptidase A1 domain-containing protein n=1 Tax=Sporothrix stenoceras TaxID=5173 RepID=A0ABR3Z2V7_9PEZI